MADEQDLGGRKSISGEIVRLSDRLKGKKDDLNEKQELFCQFISKGMTQKEAARKAGYEGADNVVSVQASRLMKNDHVLKRLTVLREQGVADVRLTKELYIAQLSALRDKAERHGQFSSAIKSQELIGKLHGYFDAEESKQTIGDKISKLPPHQQMELAQKAMRKMGELYGTRIGITVDHVDKPIDPKDAG